MINYTRLLSLKNKLICVYSVYADFLSSAYHRFEFNLTVDECEEGVIGATADVVAGMDLGASLAKKDVAGSYKLTVLSLNAETLGLTVTTVLGRTDTFFMCKELNRQSEHGLSSFQYYFKITRIFFG